MRKLLIDGENEIVQAGSPNCFIREAVETNEYQDVIGPIGAFTFVIGE